MGIRTPDLLIANETLYQLSYDPAPIADGGNAPNMVEQKPEASAKKTAGNARRVRINSCARPRPFYF